MEKIENVELKYLTLEDFEELKEATEAAYLSMPNSYWKLDEIGKLISLFPEGQIVIKVNGDIAGCALSVIVDFNEIDDNHTYDDIAGDTSFKIHDEDGDTLYGIDVFIKPDYRGLRLGRRLYDYRKELCENLNLKGIVFGGRIPNYHKFSKDISPLQYIEKVRSKEIHDPVLNFQLSNDFHPVRILKGYLEGDDDSGEYAVLM